MSDNEQRKEDTKSDQYEELLEQRAAHEWLDMIGQIGRADPAYWKK